MQRLRRAGRAPLAIAAVLATPLFFVSLMATSLAVERPATTTVVRRGELVTRFEPPSTSTEAKIWLLALIAPAIVLLVGCLALLVPYGVFFVPATAMAVTLATTLRLDSWTARHTDRFPTGTDLIPDASNDSTLRRGEWEQTANDTATSLARWTIVLGVASLLIFGLLELRRRRGPVPPPPPPPPEAVTGESQAVGGGTRRWWASR